MNECQQPRQPRQGKKSVYAGWKKMGWMLDKTAQAGRRSAGSCEVRSLDDCLGLVQAVNLQLAVRHSRVEVDGDEVAPGGDLPQEVKRRVELVLVRRALCLLCHHLLLLARDLALEVGLGALELRDRVVDLRLEGRLRGFLLGVGLLDVLLDVGLDQREDVEDALALTLRLLVGVRLPGVRWRRRRLAGLDEGLLPLPANLRHRLREGWRLREGVVFLQRGDRGLNQRDGLGVVGLVCQVPRCLLLSLFLSILHFGVQLLNLLVDLLDRLVRRSDLGREAIDRLRIDVDLLGRHLRDLGLLRPLLLAVLLLLEVFFFLLSQIFEHLVDGLNYCRERIVHRLHCLRERVLVRQQRNDQVQAGVLRLQCRLADRGKRKPTPGMMLPLLRGLRLDEGLLVLGLEGLLERVPRVVGPEDADRLADGGNLLGPHFAALVPVVGLLLAGVLRVREENLVALVLALAVLLLLRRGRQRLGARALLLRLVEKRLFRRVQLLGLRGHERVEIRLCRLLRLGRGVAVVLEGRSHVLQDVQDAARTRRILLLEGRVLLELLVVHFRHLLLQRLHEAVHVPLREEARAELGDALQLGRHGAQRRSVHLHGLDSPHSRLERNNRLVHLILCRQVILVLLLTHSRLLFDSLLESLDLSLQIGALRGEFDLTARKVIDVRRELLDASCVLLDRLSLRGDHLRAPALVLGVEFLL